LVVVADIALGNVGLPIVADVLALFEVNCLDVAEDRFAAQVLRPFQRGDRAEIPDALQVGGAPGRTLHGPRVGFRCLGCDGYRDKCRECNRRGGERKKESMPHLRHSLSVVRLSTRVLVALLDRKRTRRAERARKHWATSQGLCQLVRAEPLTGSRRHEYTPPRGFAICDL